MAKTKVAQKERKKENGEKIKIKCDHVPCPSKFFGVWKNLKKVSDVSAFSARPNFRKDSNQKW